MCFQGFAYFVCGHSRIVTADCEYAQTIDHPFFIHTACPDYHSSSERPPWQCGLGRFYCRELPDGSGYFLDDQYQQRKDAQNAITNIDQQLAQATVAGQQLVYSAKQHGIPDDVIKQIPKFRGIQSCRQQLQQQRIVQVRAGEQAAQFMSDGETHFANIERRKLAASGNGIMPPFVPSTGRIPAELMPTNLQQPADATTPFLPRAQRPQNPLHHPQLPSPAGSSIDVVPVVPRTLSSQRVYGSAHAPPSERPGLTALVGRTGTEAFTRRAGDRMQPPAPLAKKHGRGQKGGRRKAAANLVDEDIDDADVVRRSTRTRGKQVNYAESVPSSTGSREPSPAKSDVSGFSPAKSDKSFASEEKSGRRKRQDSAQLRDETRSLRAEPLREKISKWKQTGSATHTSSTPLQRRAMPGMKDILNTSPATRDTSDKEATSSSPDAFKPKPTQFIPTSAPSRLPHSSSDIPRSMVGAQQARALPGMPPYQGRSSFSGAMPATQATNLFTGYRNFNRPSTSPAMSTPAMLASPFQHINNYQRLYGQQGQNLQNSLLASGVPADLRRDSVMARDQKTNAEAYNPAQQSYNTGEETWMQPRKSYDDLRRSFSFTAALAPNMAPQQSPESLEPKKRALPSSSPQEESAKRMRLSLPGQDADSPIDDEDWMLDRNVRANTPLQPVQQFSRSGTENQPGLSSMSTMVAPPAPVFAPEAVMSQRDHSKAISAAISAVAGASDLPSQQFPGFENGDGDDAQGLDFSDNIDWLQEGEEFGELP